MFHVKDDFKPGAPVSAVPATWFNKVGAFLNNFVAGDGLRMFKNESGATVISLDESTAVADTSTPEELGSYPTASVTQTEETLWDRTTADAGVAVRVAWKARLSGATRFVYAAQLVFDRNGRLAKIVAKENEGWKV